MNTEPNNCDATLIAFIIVGVASIVTVLWLVIKYGGIGPNYHDQRPD